MQALTEAVLTSVIVLESTGCPAGPERPGDQR